VTGRVKDMIIRGGRHYFPYELEDTVGRMPGVVRGGVAVCGARDERSGTEQVVIIA
jgi:fatty-acyl-CoA synthase